MQMYDVDADSWSYGPPMPFARGGMAAFGLFGRLHVIGGETSFPPPEDDVFSSSQGVYGHTALYDPALRAWQWGASMPTAVHGVFPVRIDAQTATLHSDPLRSAPLPSGWSFRCSRVQI